MITLITYSSTFTYRLRYRSTSTGNATHCLDRQHSWYNWTQSPACRTINLVRADFRHCWPDCNRLWSHCCPTPRLMQRKWLRNHNLKSLQIAWPLFDSSALTVNVPTVLPMQHRTCVSFPFAIELDCSKLRHFYAFALIRNLADRKTVVFVRCVLQFWKNRNWKSNKFDKCSNFKLSNAV